MNPSLSILRSTLKEIATHLKIERAPLSFILITGKSRQGKTTLLRQSGLNHYKLDPEINVNFFYDQHAIFLELGESWLDQDENLLAHALQYLNRSHKSLKISGIILCIDSNELLLAEPLQLNDECKSHGHLLVRFSQALKYPIDTAIILTKLDALAGFCEFFQSDRTNEPNKPLGFSLDGNPQQNKLLTHYKFQFETMIETLGQQIIYKLHPARSSVKRTLIREFPLQLAGLARPIHMLIQHLPLNSCRLQAIYFTSAEQGGLSVDRLNKKIQHEYSLTVQDKFPQSSNYRAYFIQGALHSFKQQAQYEPPSVPHFHRWVISVVGIWVAGVIFYLGYHFWVATNLLEDTKKELLTYETLSNKNIDKTAALYHLSLAESKMDLIHNGLLPVTAINHLKKELHEDAKIKLHDAFLPQLLSSLEKVITNPSQTHLARYQALKIYLMLGDPQHFSSQEITTWFKTYWRLNSPTFTHEPFALLNHALQLPFQPLTLNQQLIIDTRNYLNALPATYLYYSLAKGNFSTQKIPIKIPGFELASKELPIYFTKKKFKQTIDHLAQIATQLQQENWVLAREDLTNLAVQLQDAYCIDYVNWWQNFSRKTQPEHYQSYEQAHHLLATLQQTGSVKQLIRIIQQETSPEIAGNTLLFNQKIANAFTGLNLLSSSTGDELNQNINELEKFLTTLSLIKDNSQTVFNITKSRFQNEFQADPLSALYFKSRQLPEPISNWIKQLADDTWVMFIAETKKYLTQQWQSTVFTFYETTIANRYPFDSLQKEEISLTNFNQFFAPQGILNTFVNDYIKPFLDTNQPQWKPKALNDYIMPISSDLINELIRANVISNMFFTDNSKTSKIDFSLQKINLDPVVASLQLTLGTTTLTDNQSSESYTLFSWPQNDAKLSLTAIDGSHYELAEIGVWGFFKMLQKVNVLTDTNDSSSLQILFEVNGNSGRYLLKTQNQINPFSPGILTGFNLSKEIT